MTATANGGIELKTKFWRKSARQAAFMEGTDKGGADAIWLTELYHAEGLSYNSSYPPLDHDITDKHQTTISQSITDLMPFDNVLSPTTTQTLHCPFRSPAQIPWT